MKRLFFIFILALVALFAEAHDVYETDTMHVDSLHQPKKYKHTFFKSIVEAFTKVDTNYIELPHFKFQAMLQTEVGFEFYNVSASDGRKLRLSPNMRTRIGPYVGYSAVFLGYALHINHLYVGNYNKEFDITLYTPVIGVDFFYRDNGQDFNISSMSLGDGYDASVFKGRPFNGFTEKQKGINVFYIFNHRHLSYPAAYNQSTRQKRSAGSFIAGFGWSQHSVGINWKALDEMISGVYPHWDNSFSENQLFENINYDCYMLSAGYAFNWVPIRNFLFGISATAGLGYNRTRLENGKKRPFDLDNLVAKSLCFDGVGRVGAVYNNDRIFVGVSMVFHSYNFRAANYHTNDIFGKLNIYAGFNFGKKKQYRKAGKFFEF